MSLTKTELDTLMKGVARVLADTLRPIDARLDALEAEQRTKGIADRLASRLGPGANGEGR